MLVTDEIDMRLWLIEMELAPKSKADREKFDISLAKLAAEDPSFLVSVDPESGRALLKGMDEQHLDSKVDILRRTHKVEVSVGHPQIAYRETITRRAKVDHTYKKRIGSTGEFARVILEIEPNERGKGYEFEAKVVDETVRKEFIPGIENGLNSVISSGVVAGFPVIDVKVALVDGAYHEHDSSVITFEIAARAALHDGLRKAGSVLLEPIMKVDVTTPEDYLGGIIGDLNSRHGHIIGTGSRDNAQRLTAMVALARMFGYADSLRLMSRGRATFIMQFDHYARAPLPLAEGDPPFRPATGMRA